MFIKCFALLLLSLVLILFGCAGRQVKKAIAQYKEILDPRIGEATQEDMVRQFGLPQRKERIGESEFWHYHLSRGMRGGAYTPGGYAPVYPHGIYVPGSYTTMSAHEMYDDLTLEFSASGRFISWRAFVQR